MSGPTHRYPMWQWIGMVAGTALALLLAIAIIRIADRPEDGRPRRARTASTTNQRIQPGVRATLTAGDITVQRTLPAMAFTLQPGESLDARLPAGPFSGVFEVTFLPGEVREAYLGAIFQGGSIILRHGDHLVIAGDYAGEQEKQTLAKMPVSFTRRPQTVTYEFKSDGHGPARLRAIWQPLLSQVPLPLPSGGEPLLANDAVKGFALAQQFNCASCHVSGDPELQRQLAVNPAPVLGGIGARVRPDWIRQWLSKPQAVKQGAAMPQLFHRSPNDRETIEDLTHFLVSLGGPIEQESSPPDADLAATGMVQYHTVGCFACHGPLEPTEALPGGHRTPLTPMRFYTPMGEMARKTTVDALADFLLDPVKVHPSGRMPSQKLSKLESESIAAYLIARDLAKHPSQQDEAFAIDPQRVQRGRERFSARGCANCHSLGPDYTPIEPALTAPTLESLANVTEPSGCLSIESDGKSPHFTLTRSQRAALIAFLQSLPERRNNNVPHDALAASITRLNCTACHEFHGERGPEPYVSQYFAAVAEADLGDEGRLPPNLTDVGAKLNPMWMREVLENGTIARPYMGARMPQYGEANVHRFPELFAAAAGVLPEPDDGPTMPPEYASIGRELVGSKGFACMQCHTIAGHEATGTPGPDLAQMPERLRYDAFTRWLHDPAQMRPGTRMPSFFTLGRSSFTSYLNGDADAQIDAIWAYLSQGQMLPLPEGLVDREGLALHVMKEPIVFRTFMKHAGVRTIACGFPEQIHCAFDADKCRLAAIWEGDFLNAAGAWANRGGTETNPQGVAWTAGQEPTVRIVGQGDGSDGTTPQPAQVLKFRGYRLDAQRKPVFMYDVIAGDAIVRVEEQPIPTRLGGRPRLIRSFKMQGQPGMKLAVLDREVIIDAAGQAAIDVEVTW